jgi:hypothetical protein
MSTNEQGPQSRTDLQSSQCNGAYNRPAYTIGDGIRMLGHLLEHHPTTGYYAKTVRGHCIGWAEKNASCFCYFGGMNAVSVALGRNRYDEGIYDSCVEVTGLRTGRDWDCLTDEERLEVAKKLQAYKD